MMTPWILIITLTIGSGSMLSIDVNSKTECERIANKIMKNYHPDRYDYKCIERNKK